MLNLLFPVYQLLPVPLAFQKLICSILPYLSQVFYVGLAVDWLEEVKFLAGFKIIALPAAFDSLLLAAFPHLAGRRASSAPARFLASYFYHCAKNIVALLVILENFKEWDRGEELRHLPEF